MNWKPPRTPQQMYQQFKPIRRVATLEQEVPNDLWAHRMHLVARSHRTHCDRTIQYAWVLDPSYWGPHASLVRALQRIVGIKRTRP